jgi:hypothetical protein
MRATADADGRYAVRWVPRVPGLAQLTAAYAGTEGSAASNGFASTIVSKRASAVALGSTRRALSVTLTATLTGGHVDRTVVITANDVVIARRNLAATEKLVVSYKLRSGTTTFQATYAGDDWYDASRTRVTIAR